MRSTKGKNSDTMRTMKEKVSITLDADLLTTLRALAESDDRNLSQFINMTLKKYISSLNLNEKPKRKNTTR